MIVWLAVTDWNFSLTAVTSLAGEEEIKIILIFLIICYDTANINIEQILFFKKIFLKKCSSVFYYLIWSPK